MTDGSTSRKTHREKLLYNSNRNLKLPVHGDKVKKKRKNMFRLFYENVDGLLPTSEQNLQRETKVSRLKSFLIKYDIDIAAFSEVRVQWDMVSETSKLKNIFRSNEELRTITGHNVHEDFTTKQQGGTCMLVGSSLGSTIADIGTDDTGLGRWCWVKFSGQDGHTSRIITAYQPVRSGRIDGNTTYAQHRRYWRSKGDKLCPLLKFRHDLSDCIRKWRDEGDRILLVGDFNENCNSGPLHKILTDKDLNMEDAIYALTRRKGPATWIKGQRQIDAAFKTKDFDISRGCFLPFFVGVGDHRGIILDIPHASMLGERILTVTRPAARRLINTPNTKKKYNKELERYFKEHKLQKRINAVSLHLSYPLSREIKHELNSIDTVREKGMLLAERKCRKLMMGMIDFSPEVNMWGRRAYLWKLILRLKDGKRISRSKIKRLAKGCGVEKPLSTSRNDASSCYKVARRQYLRRKPHATALREKFLERQIKDSYLVGDEKKIRQIKTLMKQESQRKAWRTIKHCTKNGQLNGVSKVEVQVNGIWTRVESQKDIESAIMEENSKRFRLTEKSPLMSGVMLSYLEYMGNTEAAADILSGAFIPPAETDSYTKTFLEQLRRDDDRLINTNITTEDFQQYWRKARERTASSISGLHFGHYKAAADNSYLSSIHAQLTSLASNCGFSYDRWHKGLSVMLEKEAGVIKVNKLRAILLMEADFNFHNKEIFGRRMVQKAEEDKTLPWDQYGSRKNHRAIEVAFNRMIFFDTLRLKRRNGVLASVDAAQCYDRIVHSALSLCCQNYGVPVTAVACMVTAIQAMKFHLRTAFGDSRKFYGGRSEVPFQGSCQGNGASPAIWLVVSSLIIRCMYYMNLTIQLNSAITMTAVTFVVFAFVDDTDLPRMATSPYEPIETVITNLQESISTWNGLLKTTGGALRPEKCFWYLIQFYWDSKGNWKYMPARGCDAQIMVPDSTGIEKAIDKLEVTNSRKAVGCIQRADGSMQEEFEQCRQKMNDWADQVKGGKLSKRLAWIGLRGQLWAGLRYKLPVTSFTKEEGDNIVKRLYWEILPTLGTCRNFPIVYRHASLQYYGLEMPHPYVEQGIAGLEMLLTYGNSDCLSGSVLTVEIEQLQLEVGGNKFFLQLDHKRWGTYVTKCWLWNLWEFISEYGIEIETTIQLPKTQRQGDWFLMERAHQIFSNKSALKSINKCRLFLEALTMADLTTGDGQQLKNNVLNVERPCNETSKYEWPTEHPSAQDKRVWKEFIHNMLGGSMGISPHLGSWSHLAHRQCQWWFSNETHLLYRRVNDRYVSFNSQRSSIPRRGWHFEPHNTTEDLPEDVMVATARYMDSNTVIFGGCASIDEEEVLDSTNICAVLHQLEFCEMFNNLSVPESTEAIAEGIRSGTITCIADGSFQDRLSLDIASAAWIIEAQSTGDQIKGVCLTPNGNTGSYRAELTGVYAMLCVIYAVCKVHDISNGQIDIGCDNDQSIRNSKFSDLKVNQKLKCVDLVRAIRRVKKSIPIDMNFIEVKGHLDETIAFEELDRVSQLNVLCDTMAKSFLETAHKQGVTNGGEISHERMRARIGTHKFTSSVGIHVRNWISHNAFGAHLLKKSQMTNTVFNLIDWEAIGSMMRDSTTAFRTWISKFVSGFCGVGRRLHMIGYWQDSLCPCCKQVEETTWHVPKCANTLMVDRFDEFVDDLKKWLKSHNTEKHLSTAIISYVKGKGNRSFHMENRRDLATLVTHMNEIGWNHFMEGKISKCMSKIHHQHLIENRLQGSASKWASGLVYMLTRGVLSMWLERNKILHRRCENGLKEKESAHLETDIMAHLNKGSDDLSGQEKEAWEEAMLDIWHRSGEEQKSWVRTMNIARNQATDQTDEEEQDGEETCPRKDRRKRRQTDQSQGRTTNKRAKITRSKKRKKDSIMDVNNN